MERKDIVEQYKQDRSAKKNGYYDYEEWLEERLIKAEAELKKLRVGDVSGSVCGNEWHESNMQHFGECHACGLKAEY